MPNYVPPGDKSNGQDIDAITDWNPLKNGIASYLNNGGIGNAQVSGNPSEKIDEAKLNLTAPTGNHHTRHEPGGADKVVNIDILGTGTLLSAHAARHASGGADPLPAGSIVGSMLALGAIVESSLTGRRDAETFLSKAFGLTFSERGKLVFNHPNGTATPRGNGVVRSGKVYFACDGIDAVTELTPSSGTFVNVLFTVGDKPNAMCLIGTDIYVTCFGDGATIKPKIKKIDANNAVTTICDITTDGAAKITSANGMRYLLPHPDGTVVYTCVKAGAASETRIARISLTPAVGVTHNFDAGGTARLSSLAFVRAGANDYIICLDNGVAANTTIRRHAAADLTGGTTITTPSAANAATQAVYDGGLYVIMDVGATQAIRYWDVATTTMSEVLNIGVPTNSPAVATFPAPYVFQAFFDGKAVYFPSDTATAIMIVVPAGRYGGAFNAKVDSTAGLGVAGMATDGTMLWCCPSSAGTAHYVRILLI
jgi:hypothetical protein